MSNISAVQEAFFDHLGFPDVSRIDKRIFKRMVLEHGQLTAADKKALSADVVVLTWKYTLKASTIQVRPYEDTEREYLEIAVIEVVLTSRKRAARLAEVIQRAIPYPVLLVMVEGAGFCVGVAHKRFSQAEAGRIVAEGFLTTPWAEQSLSEIDRRFREALALPNLSQVDFHAMYGDMVAVVLARTCAELTGQFELDTSQPETDRRARFERCRQMERDIVRLRVSIREEDRFAEKVDLNIQIKALEAALAQAKTTL